MTKFIDEELITLQEELITLNEESKTLQEELITLNEESKTELKTLIIRKKMELFKKEKTIQAKLITLKKEKNKKETRQKHLKIYQLYYFTGNNIAKIAKQTNYSENSIKNIYHRIRKEIANRDD